MTEAPRLVIEISSGARAGEQIALAVGASARVGRADEAEISLPDGHLSGQHGALRWEAGRLLYQDSGSANGSVHVRGGTRTPLDHRCPEVELWEGDALHLGDPDDPVILRLRLPDEPAAADLDAGEVIAARPIGEVEAYTGRITAEALATLHRAASELGRQTDLEAVLATSAALVFQLLPQATHLAVAMEQRGGAFPVVFASARSGEQVEIPVSRTLIHKVREARAALLLTNAAELGARSVARAGIASTLGLPLWTGDHIRGVLQVDNRDRPGLFDASDLECLTVAAGNISFAAENARLVARLRLAERRLERENSYLKRREQHATFPGIAGRSRAIGAVLDAVEKVRDTRVPVLIEGETGTGKELIARALHYGSRRGEQLFVPQNCAALSETLLESELFGHARGAFTGADRDRKGLFELADGGTIFLDEVGEMSTGLQAKLLRVLQEGEVWPVGASRPRKVDVRVVSATHRNLEKMVEAGSFRQDLYYRLHVYPIRVPPLRERREDIPVLARHFLERYAPELGRAVTSFATDAVERLSAYDWPGNVRELQNEIQRILIGKTSGDVVLAADLSPRLLGETGILDDPRVPRGTLKEMMASVERVLLARALREHDNNKTRTAATLGITREGLHKKLARFGMK